MSDTAMRALASHRIGASSAYHSLMTAESRYTV